ncbi:MAG TPA: hypothetical protein VLA20_11265 [Vicinamibacterales bacterium]|nr:hypothetical protein [Vicinamibacterales bacterium]
MRNVLNALVATRIFDDERAEVSRKAKGKKEARRAARSARVALTPPPPPGPSAAHPRITDAGDPGLRV